MGSSRVRRRFLWIPFLLLSALVAVFAVGGVALADEEYDVELPDTMVRLDQDGQRDHNGAVDLDQAVEDHFFTMASAGDAGVGHNFL